MTFMAMKTMIWGNKGFFAALFGILMVLLACDTANAQIVEKDSTHWVGEWRDDGNLQYGYNLHLKPLSDGKMGGYFEWKLIWTSLPDHMSKVGAVAREYLIGTYDPATHALNLKGYRRVDPSDIISMDVYILKVSPDSKSLEGINVKPGNYHGSMFGIYLPPKTPPAKPKPTIAAKNEPVKTVTKAGANPASNPDAKPSTNPVKPTKPAPVQPQPTVTTPIVTAAPDKELASREIVTKKELKSADSQVRIRVYDESIIDGDVISLNWNGEWVTRYYRVAKMPKEIVLDLHPGENTLVMFAENLGRYPPNTASISVQRAGKTEVFVLNSDMGKSEAIKFFRE